MTVKILAGLSNQKLARDLALRLHVGYVETHITNFADSETRVQVAENVHQCDVIIVQSTVRPANDRLMELLLLIDAVKRANAKSVTAVLPYFGYSRQDRNSYPYAPVSAHLVVKLLEAAGVDNVVTIDLHTRTLERLFSIPIVNLDTASLVAPIIMGYSKPTVVVFPDTGSSVRTAEAIKRVSNVPMVVINKIRDLDNKINMAKVIGNVEGKNCLIIDDIIDSGETLYQGANLLMENGAVLVDAFVTHPVLSSEAKKLVQTSCIKKIYITDTIEANNLPSKFHVLSVEPIIIEALQQFKIL